MKVTCLLPVPFLLASLVDAAEYLVRFKEGAAADSQPPDVSRIEVSHAGARSKSESSSHSKFDYNSNELFLTFSQAHDRQSKGGRNGKSKTKVETFKTFDIDNKNESGNTSPIADQDAIKIKSKGRWFTFDDSDFHIWHGDFTE